MSQTKELLIADINLMAKRLDRFLPLVNISPNPFLFPHDPRLFRHIEIKEAHDWLKVLCGKPLQDVEAAWELRPADAWARYLMFSPDFDHLAEMVILRKALSGLRKFARVSRPNLFNKGYVHAKLAKASAVALQAEQGID